MLTRTDPTRLPPPDPFYPESDGRPIGENTIQLKWIITLYLGFTALYRGRPDVFVAGDLFWYPVEGDNTIVQAPDVLVAFGRPPHERRTFQQWNEGGVAPQAVFEVLSPNNTYAEMRRKLAFYQRYGVQEYYEYDPDEFTLQVWRRTGRRLVSVEVETVYASTLLGVRFEVPGGEPMRVVRPDGEAFPFIDTLAARATGEREAAERRRAVRAERRAKRAEAKAASLADKLRRHGIDPDAP